ncbi:RNA polymerase sigma factor [Nocardia asteroides]
MDQPAPDIGPVDPIDAFSTFYRRFVPVLVGFLVTHGARFADAADIAQDTMAKAWTAWDRLHDPERWTRRVASRELIHRKAASAEDPAPDIPERNPLLFEHSEYTAWEQQHEILRVISLLPDRQRQVLAWTMQEYTPKEIAEELGITADAVRANLFKARRAIAKILGLESEER